MKSWTAFRGWPRAAQIACSVLAALLALGAIGAAAGSSPKKTSATTTAASASPAQSSSSSATSAPADQPDGRHPSATLTPGATFATVTRVEVCTRGYSASVRSVSESDRDAVYRAYGLAGVDHSDYVIDHLVPLELGGSNDAKNLWPQPRHAAAGDASTDKDTIENELHDLVCSGEVSLVDAQRAIVRWDTVDVATLVSTTTTTATTTTVSPTTLPPTTVPETTLPPVTAPPTTVAATPDCTPGYDPCIPPGSDVDCAGGSGNGPRYVSGPVYVTGSDPYRLDSDHNGVACE